MEPIEMLEKLVEAEFLIKFIKGIHGYVWQYSSDRGGGDYNHEKTFAEAITALYNAAIKAYPERFK